jgi:hypothetical protein
VQRVCSLTLFFLVIIRIISELECLRGIPEVQMLVVQTPHFICEARLDGVYGAALSRSNISSTVDQCADHLTSFTALSRSRAYTLCRDGTFTGAGTTRLAARLKTVIRTHFLNNCDGTPFNSLPASSDVSTNTTSVCLLDAHRITAAVPNCSEVTSDGRHYRGRVLQEEVTHLLRFLIPE